MKLLRLTLSIISLVVVIGVGTTLNAAEAAGEKCNCIYTNGELGVQRDGDCQVVNCWVPIGFEIQ